MSVSLEYHCRFTSPFHSSAHNFSNVYTCAPFVPGSALRGAALRWLIDRYCTRVDELHQDNPGYHRECDAGCDIKALFEPQTRFTFGFFESEASHPGSLTRVSIGRDTRSAAAGGLVTTEVRYGVFRFWVQVPEAAHAPLMNAAVKGAGELGVGRNKGIGWGRFEVTCSSTGSLPVNLGEGPRFHWRFRSPYVLSNPEQADPKDAIQQSLKDHGLPEAQVEVRKASFSYFRRWSYEKDERDNRLVADADTEVEVEFQQPPDVEALKKLAWGLGEWKECGFGMVEACR